MPRYELMYILASSVSDDLVPDATKQIEQYVSDNKGTDITHELLGKKKLAYPIKKTRNGHYGVIGFNAEGQAVNALDAKLRTQKATVIRHIIVNLDEHLERLAKDKEAQAKMNRNRPADKIAEDKAEQNLDNAKAKSDSVVKPKVDDQPKAEVTAQVLDEEIEKALNENLN